MLAGEGPGRAGRERSWLLSPSRPLGAAEALPRGNQPWAAAGAAAPPARPAPSVLRGFCVHSAPPHGPRPLRLLLGALPRRRCGPWKRPPAPWDPLRARRKPRSSQGTPGRPGGGPSSVLHQPRVGHWWCQVARPQLPTPPDTPRKDPSLLYRGRNQARRRPPRPGGQWQSHPQPRLPRPPEPGPQAPPGRGSVGALRRPGGAGRELPLPGTTTALSERPVRPSAPGASPRVGAAAWASRPGHGWAPLRPQAAACLLTARGRPSPASRPQLPIGSGLGLVGAEPPGLQLCQRARRRQLPGQRPRGVPAGPAHARVPASPQQGSGVTDWRRRSEPRASLPRGSLVCTTWPRGSDPKRLPVTLCVASAPRVRPVWRDTWLRPEAWTHRPGPRPAGTPPGSEWGRPGAAWARRCRSGPRGARRPPSQRASLGPPESAPREERRVQHSILTLYSKAVGAGASTLTRREGAQSRRGGGPGAGPA